MVSTRRTAKKDIETLGLQNGGTPERRADLCSQISASISRMTMHDKCVSNEDKLQKELTVELFGITDTDASSVYWVRETSRGQTVDSIKRSIRKSAPTSLPEAEQKERAELVASADATPAGQRVAEIEALLKEAKKALEATPEGQAIVAFDEAHKQIVYTIERATKSD